MSRQPNDPPKAADPKPPVTLPLAGETPAPAPAWERPPASLKWKAKDLLWYPLIVDIFSDIILKKDLSESERKKFKLKGYEGGALMSWAAASLLASEGLGGSSYGEDFLKNLKLWYSYTEAIQPLTPHKDVLMDGLSTLFNMRVDEYLGSDLFAARLKTHPLSLLSIGALLQGGLSLQSELKKPDPADEGKLVTADWAKHTMLGVMAVNLILKQETGALSDPFQDFTGTVGQSADEDGHGARRLGSDVGFCPCRYLVHGPRKVFEHAAAHVAGERSAETGDPAGKKHARLRPQQGAGAGRLRSHHNAGHGAAAPGIFSLGVHGDPVRGVVDDMGNPVER